MRRLIRYLFRMETEEEINALYGKYLHSGGLLASLALAGYLVSRWFTFAEMLSRFLHILLLAFGLTVVLWLTCFEGVESFATRTILSLSKHSNRPGARLFLGGAIAALGSELSAIFVFRLLSPDGPVSIIVSCLSTTGRLIVPLLCIFVAGGVILRLAGPLLGARESQSPDDELGQH